MKLLSEEVWKDIEGYEGFYQVSNKGRVKSLDRTIVHKNGKHFFLKGKILRSRPDKDGYQLVTLYRNNKKDDRKVHRLVAEAFIKNDDTKNKTQVNHIDESKDNNNVNNLEWISQENNLNYGTSRQRQGETHRGWKPTEEQRKRLRESHKHCRFPSWAIKKAREATKKPVRCIETGVVYESCIEAANAIGAHPSSLCDALKGRSSMCKNLHWEYFEREN